MSFLKALSISLTNNLANICYFNKSPHAFSNIRSYLSQRTRKSVDQHSWQQSYILITLNQPVPLVDWTSDYDMIMGSA